MARLQSIRHLPILTLMPQNLHVSWMITAASIWLTSGLSCLLPPIFHRSVGAGLPVASQQNSTGLPSCTSKYRGSIVTWGAVWVGPTKPSSNYEGLFTYNMELFRQLHNEDGPIKHNLPESWAQHTARLQSIRHLPYLTLMPQNLHVSWLITAASIWLTSGLSCLLPPIFHRSVGAGLPVASQ